MPVDTTIPLFHPVWIPRNFIVNQARTEVLEVQTFRCSIRGQQNSHRADVGGRLKCGLHFFSQLRVHATVHCQQSVAGGEAFTGKNFLQPMLSRSVFRKNDDPFLAPFSAGFQVRLQPFNQLADFGVPLA